MPDEITPAPAPHKPGYKTTEFWLTLAAVLVGLLMASGVIGDGSALGKGLAFIASALASAGYSYARGIVKAG